MEWNASSKLTLRKMPNKQDLFLRLFIEDSKNELSLDELHLQPDALCLLYVPRSHSGMAADVGQENRKN